MVKELGIAEAREQFTRIPEIFEEEPETHVLEVTRHGRPVFAVIPWALYEEIAETLEIMADGGFSTEVRQGIKDLENGNTTPFEEVKAELGL